jgi:hypothetical protein
LLQLLASNILNPRTIDVSIDDIGGLDEVKEEMVRHQPLCVLGGAGSGQWGGKQSHRGFGQLGCGDRGV